MRVIMWNLKGEGILTFLLKMLTWITFVMSRLPGSVWTRMWKSYFRVFTGECWCVVLYLCFFMYKKVEVLFLCLSRKVSACLRKEKFACGLEFGTKGERWGKSDEMYWRVVWGCVGLCIVVCNRVWAKECEANLKGVKLVEIFAHMEEEGRLLDKSFF